MTEPDLSFDAVIEASPGGGGGAYVRLPAEAAHVFGTTARVPVAVTFDGIAYRGSTMPMGDGISCVGILKAIRTRAGVGIGDTVRVTVTRDTTERVVEVPHDLAAALRGDDVAAAAFDKLAYTHRKEHVTWVTEAKRPETRARRVQQTLEKLRPT